MRGRVNVAGKRLVTFVHLRHHLIFTVSAGRDLQSIHKPSPQAREARDTHLGKSRMPHCIEREAGEADGPGLARSRRASQPAPIR